MGAPGGVMLDSPLETRRDRSFRLAVVASHPVQYYAPWFARIAEQHDLEVLYCHRQDAGGQSEAGFGVQFDWDLDLLSGYQSRWLSNVAKEPGLQAFRGCDTPELDSIIRDGRFDAVLALGWNRKSYLQAAQA
ncbi:MAG: hypothetical protein OEU54_10875, partial [Gemmatimonadota bacterium]|nr:hypothetical protein [Gemmatimonadota bacterium]